MDKSDRWFEARFWEALEELEGDPREALDRLEKFNASQLGAPLRSWALVLRANDTRVKGWGTQSLSPSHPREYVEREVVRLDKAEVARLCGPVEIPWPGVSVGEAARRLGVSKKTVWQWTNGVNRLTGESVNWQEKKEAVAGHLRGGKAGPRKQRGSGEASQGQVGHPVGRLVRRRGRVLVRDVYVNLADRKRDEVRVWAEAGVDPNGQVFAGPWGTVRKRLVERVGEDFEQEAARGRRAIARKDGGRDARPTRRDCGEYGQWGWECPRCGAWVHKVYWAMTPWTVAARAVGLQWQAGAAWREGFACRRCAGLVYESSERRWAKGRKGEEIFWRRFVRRMMGGISR